MKKGRKLAESYGYKVAYFVGDNIRVQGNTVRGVVDTENKTVMVRADHSDLTPLQIMRHEMGHAAIARGDFTLAELRERLLKGFTDAEIDEMVEVYSNAYGGILSTDEAFEEICCDALGKINIFAGTKQNSASYVKAQRDIRKYAAERTGAEGRAPPKNGGEKYSIETLPDGKKYVRADRQVIFGNDPASWSEQLEDYINGKIRRGQNVQLIAEDGDVLTLTAKTAGKVASRYKDGKTMSDEEYSRKVSAGAHIDELVQVSTRGNSIIADEDGRHGDSASEGWNHRTAYFLDFDGKYYRCKISVSMGADGSIVYNIGDMRERSFPTAQEVHHGSSAKSGALGREASSENSIRSSEENVNEKFSREVKDAEEYFGTTYKIKEAGYICTDGKMLDFSGRHEGAQGGYRTVDHRDITDALGEDYGDGDYSGGMVKFMSEGNIRVSPEIGGINLSVAPNKSQRSTLDRYISSFKGEVVLDIDNTNGDTVASVEYPKYTHSSVVLKDIDDYFNKGKVPEPFTSGVKYSLEGKNKDGIEVYTTSEDVRSLTRKERQKKFLEIMQNEYRGRTAKFNRNGHVYYATFDSRDVNKNIYGDRRSSNSGYNAKLKVGADGNIFELVENSKYKGSKVEQGKNTQSHKQVRFWDYFVKTVQIDNEVFDLLANVRRKSDGDYVYSIQLRANKSIEASAAQQPNQKVGVNKAANASDNSISSSEGNVKASRETDAKYMAAVESGDMEAAQKMADEAALNWGAITDEYDTDAPLTVYHATDDDFTKFDRSQLGKNTMANASSWEMGATSLIGHWFSDHDIKSRIGAARQGSYYLNIEHPYEISLYDLADDIAAFADDYNALEEDFENGETERIREVAERYVDKLRSDGYDGLAVNDEEFGGVSYVVFGSEQIKSTDPVTYDDNGEVIPLSKRFDSQNEDVRYSREQSSRKAEDKYFARQIDQWDGKDHGGAFRVGGVSEPLLKVGIPNTDIWFDQSKAAKQLLEKGEITKAVIKQIPEILQHPIAISESYDNTVMVFGQVFDANGNPIVVALRVNSTKRRNSITLVNKIRSIGSRSHNLDKLLSDSNILYLAENKKETKAWFNALGRSTPFGGTKFGLIRSVSFSDAAVKASREPETLNELRRQNEQLRERVDYWKRQTKPTKVKQLRMDDIRRLAKEVVEMSETDLKPKDITCRQSRG